METGEEVLRMDRGQGHEVTATGEHRRRLIVVLVITGAVLIVEVIGGVEHPCIAESSSRS